MSETNDGLQPEDLPTEKDNQAAEEEINIGSGKPINTSNDQIAESSADSDDDNNKNRMEQHVANLQSIGSSGESADEFLDKLLQTPADQLIPWEDCYLPSKGLYYEGDWNGGLVRVKAMGQTAEKILATQRLAKSGQSIDYLFRECCQFPEGFDPINLLLGDRVFLLYFLRGITHGNMYEFAFTCPNEECQAVSTHAYDLNDLAQTITWAKSNLGAEPFRIDLPYLSKATGRNVWVGVRFLRAFDANDIMAKRKAKEKMIVKPGNTVRNRNAAAVRNRQQNQNQALDDALSENLEKVIISVMGSNDVYKIRQFVRQMHAQDTATVREWLRENTPGIDNTVIVGCPDCNADHTVELPITEAFFRPSKG